MEKTYDFLPFFINEEIYIIKENVAPVYKKEAELPVEKPEQAEPITFLGKNLQKVMVLVDGQEDEIIAPDDKAFLLSILGAVKLGLDDVAIIDFSKYSLRKNDLKSFNFSTQLCFGISETSLYQVIFKEDKKILAAHSLTAIRQDVGMKKRLWACLQEIFLKA